MPPPERSGPVAELTHAFAKEPRIESEFRKSDVAPGLLKSVLCRESVCRVEVRWTPDRAVAFMSAFTRLSADFEPDIAIDRVARQMHARSCKWMSTCRGAARQPSRRSAELRSCSGSIT